MERTLVMKNRRTRKIYWITAGAREERNYSLRMKDVAVMVDEVFPWQVLIYL